MIWKTKECNMLYPIKKKFLSDFFIFLILLFTITNYVNATGYFGIESADEAFTDVFLSDEKSITDQYNKINGFLLHYDIKRVLDKIGGELNFGSSSENIIQRLIKIISESKKQQAKENVHFADTIETDALSWYEMFNMYLIDYEQIAERDEKRTVEKIEWKDLCQIWWFWEKFQTFHDSLFDGEFEEPIFDFVELSVCDHLPYDIERTNNTNTDSSHQMLKLIELDIAKLILQELKKLLSTYENNKNMPRTLGELITENRLANESLLAYIMRLARINISKSHIIKESEKKKDGQITQSLIIKATDKNDRELAKIKKRMKEKVDQKKKTTVGKAEKSSKNVTVAESISAKNKEKLEDLSEIDIDLKILQYKESVQRILYLLPTGIRQKMELEHPIQLGFDLFCDKNVSLFYTAMFSSKTNHPNKFEESVLEDKYSKKIVIQLIWNKIVNNYFKSEKFHPKLEIWRDWSRLLDGSIPLDKRHIMEELLEFYRSLNISLGIPLDGFDDLVLSKDKATRDWLTSDIYSIVPPIRRALWTVHKNELIRLYLANKGKNRLQKFIHETKGVPGRIVLFFGNLNVIYEFYLSLAGLLHLDFDAVIIDKKLIYYYQEYLLNISLGSVNVPRVQLELKKKKALVHINVLALYKQIDQFFMEKQQLDDFEHNWNLYKINYGIFLDRLIDFRDTPVWNICLEKTAEHLYFSSFSIILEILNQKNKNSSKWDVFDIVRKAKDDTKINQMFTNIFNRKLQQLHENNIKELLGKSKEFKKNLLAMEAKEEKKLIDLIGSWPEKELGRKQSSGKFVTGKSVTPQPQDKGESSGSSSSNPNADDNPIVVDKVGIDMEEQIIVNSYISLLSKDFQQWKNEEIEQLDLLAGYQYYNTVLARLCSIVVERNPLDGGELWQEMLALRKSWTLTLKGIFCSVIYFINKKIIQNEKFKKINWMEIITEQTANLDPQHIRIPDFFLNYDLLENESHYNTLEPMIMKLKMTTEYSSLYHFYTICTFFQKKLFTKKFHEFIAKGKRFFKIKDNIRRLVGEKNMENLETIIPKTLSVDIVIRENLVEYYKMFIKGEQIIMANFDRNVAIWYYYYMSNELLEIAGAFNKEFNDEIIENIEDEIKDIYARDYELDGTQRFCNIVEFIANQIVHNDLWLAGDDNSDWHNWVKLIELKHLTEGIHLINEKFDEYSCENIKYLFSIDNFRRDIHYLTVQSLLESGEDLQDAILSSEFDRDLTEWKLVVLLGEKNYAQLQLYYPEILRIENIMPVTMRRLYHVIIENKSGTEKADEAEIRLAIPFLLHKLKSMESELSKFNSQNTAIKKLKNYEKLREKINVIRDGIYDRNGDELLTKRNICTLVHTINYIALVQPIVGAGQQQFRDGNIFDIAGWMPTKCDTEEEQMEVFRSEQYKILANRHIVGLGLFMERERHNVRNTNGVQTRINRLLQDENSAEKLITQWKLRDQEVFNKEAPFFEHYLQSVCHEIKEERIINRWAVDVFAWVHWAEKITRKSNELRQLWWKMARFYEKAYDSFLDTTPEHLKDELIDIENVVVWHYYSMKDFIEMNVNSKNKGGENYSILEKQFLNICKKKAVIKRTNQDLKIILKESVDWLNKNGHMEKLVAFLNMDTSGVKHQEIFNGLEKNFNVELDRETKSDNRKLAEEILRLTSAEELEWQINFFQLTNETEERDNREKLKDAENSENIKTDDLMISQTNTQSGEIIDENSKDKELEGSKNEEDINTSDYRSASSSTPKSSGKNTPKVMKEIKKNATKKAYKGKSGSGKQQQSATDLKKKKKSPTSAVESSLQIGSKKMDHQQHEKNRRKNIEKVIEKLELPDQIWPKNFLDNKTGDLLLAKKYMEFVLRPEEQKRLILDIGTLVNEIWHRMKMAKHLLTLGRPEDNKEYQNRMEQTEKKWKEMIKGELKEVPAQEEEVKLLKKQMITILIEIISFGDNSDETKKSIWEMPENIMRQLYWNNLAKAIQDHGFSHHWNFVVSKMERMNALTALFETHKKLDEELLTKFEKNLKNWEMLLEQQKMDQDAKGNICIVPMLNQQIVPHKTDPWIQKNDDPLTKMLFTVLKSENILNVPAVQREEQNSIDELIVFLQDWDGNLKMLPTGSYLLGTHIVGSPIECIVLWSEKGNHFADSEKRSTPYASFERLFGKDYTRCYLSARAKCRNGSLYCRLCKEKRVSFLRKIPLKELPTLEIIFNGISFNLLFILNPNEQPIQYSLTAKDDLSIEKIDELICQMLMQRKGKGNYEEKSPTIHVLSNHRSGLKLMQMCDVHFKRETFQIIVLTLKGWAKNHFIYGGHFGFLDDTTLSLLAYKILLLYPDASLAYLIEQFFLLILDWKWPKPMRIEQLKEKAVGISDCKKVDKEIGVSVEESKWPILNVGMPQLNVGHEIGEWTSKIMAKEFGIGIKKIWELKRAAKDTKNSNEEIKMGWMNFLHIDEESNFQNKFDKFLLIKCVWEKDEKSDSTFCDIAEKSIYRTINDKFGHFESIDYLHIRPDKILTGECPEGIKQKYKAWSFSTNLFCSFWLVGIKLKEEKGKNVEESLIDIEGIDEADFSKKMVENYAKKVFTKRQPFKLSFFGMHFVRKEEILKFNPWEDKSLPELKENKILDEVHQTALKGVSEVLGNINDLEMESLWPDYSTNKKEYYMADCIYPMIRRAFNELKEDEKIEIDKKKTTEGKSKLNANAKPYVPGK